MDLRAYSVFEIKSADEGAGIITGIASTPDTDRVGDIVEPKGAKFKLPIPFLWQHDKGDPIGRVTEATVTPDGIHISASIEKNLDAQVGRYWKLLKSGLVRGLSIGFRAAPGGAELMKSGGIRFKAWEWLELSAVTIPANASASIQSVKAFDLGAPMGADVVRIAPLARSSAAYSIPLKFPKE